MKPEELVDLIERSFHERSLNGGMTQRQAWEIDDQRIPLAQGHTRNHQPDITDDWRKVDSIDDTCFFEFHQKAWKYYLPAAFRIAILENKDRILPSSLAFFLLPTTGNDGDRFDPHSWSPEVFVKTWGFDTLQAYCITRVLEYLNSGYDDLENLQFKKWIELYGRDR
jgi:hypothetical protein